MDKYTINKHTIYDYSVSTLYSYFYSAMLLLSLKYYLSLMEALNKDIFQMSTFYN